MLRRQFLALPMALAAKPAARPTVAVLYFDYQGKTEALTVLRKGLAQMLISDLGIVESCTFVERDRLEALLAEQKLGQSGKIDRATAAKIGKLLGARYLVLGGYFDLGPTLRLDARVVEVQTGRVLGATGATGKADDFLPIEQQLARDLARLLADLASKAPAPVERRPRPAPPARLPTKTALAYSQALNALDKGDKAAATAGLKTVVAAQPDFALAKLDLQKLLQ